MATAGTYHSHGYAFRWRGMLTILFINFEQIFYEGIYI